MRVRAIVWHIVTNYMTDERTHIQTAIRQSSFLINPYTWANLDIRARDHTCKVSKPKTQTEHKFWKSYETFVKVKVKWNLWLNSTWTLNPIFSNSDWKLFSELFSRYYLHVSKMSSNNWYCSISNQISKVEIYFSNLWGEQKSTLPEIGILPYLVHGINLISWPMKTIHTLISSCHC